MIFFDYPDSLEVINLRSAKRVDVFLPATIKWHDEEYEGVIKDLSEGGCLFVIKYWQDEVFKDLEVGSTFPIKFQMHGDKALTEIECKVVRINKDHEELRLGFSFQKSHQNIISRIGNFVSRISKMLENGQSG
jgi:c-di-GMP-binding flagellar brake protein YcgR